MRVPCAASSYGQLPHVYTAAVVISELDKVRVLYLRKLGQVSCLLELE